MKQVTTEDAELRCEHLLQPGAPALLLMHPLGASLEIWDGQIEPLSKRYELIRFDIRGHGKSTLGAHTDLTMDQLARDALAVLDACGVARAHLCGLSIGGMIAMQAATQWPDRVLKVALCSTSAYMPTRETWQTRIDTIRSEGVAPLVDGILGRWLTEPFRQAHPDVVERIRAMLLGCDPRGYAAAAAAIRDMDLREPIRSINAKTLVIGGTEDPGTTPEHASLIARSIPGAELTMLPAAHLVNVECEEEFERRLLEFFAA